MAEPLVINSQWVIPASELRFSYARSSGPGGQNVNKLNTKAVLRWNPASGDVLPHAVLQRLTERYANRINNDNELIISSERHREQARNARDCLEKLRAMILSVASPPRVRRKKRVPRGAIEARLKSKRKRSERKQTRKPPSMD